MSPADIQAWYDANKQQLQIPEQVQVQYAVLDEAAATQGVQVETNLASRTTEQNKTRFGQPERRRVSHIMINLPAGARKMRARRLAPRPTSWTSWPWPTRPRIRRTGPQESQDAGSAANGGDLGWQQKGALPGSLDKAAFGLNRTGLRRGRKPQRPASSS